MGIHIVWLWTGRYSTSWSGISECEEALSKTDSERTVKQWLERSYLSPMHQNKSLLTVSNQNADMHVV